KPIMGIQEKRWVSLRSTHPTGFPQQRDGFRKSSTHPTSLKKPLETSSAPSARMHLKSRRPPKWELSARASIKERQRQGHADGGPDAAFGERRCAARATEGKSYEHPNIYGVFS